MIRQQVRSRAQGRCEYCHLPDIYSLVPFHVAHIIPVKRHHGSTELDNLAWACPHCNRSKQADVGAFDSQTNLLTPLYNPRLEDWSDHFSMDELGHIIALTAVGRVTIRLLDMNDPLAVQTRQTLIELKLW